MRTETQSGVSWSPVKTSGRPTIRGFGRRDYRCVEVERIEAGRWVARFFQDGIELTKAFEIHRTRAGAKRSAASFL